MTGKEAPNKRNMQKFVRYAEGAKMYSMGLSKFQELSMMFMDVMGITIRKKRKNLKIRKLFMIPTLQKFMIN